MSNMGKEKVTLTVGITPDRLNGSEMKVLRKKIDQHPGVYKLHHIIQAAGQWQRRVQSRPKTSLLLPKWCPICPIKASCVFDVLHRS